MKKVVAFFLASFLFCLPASAQVYVALGDSLAAGQTPYAQIDAGYTDFIALQLMKHGELTSFSKQLAFPGYTVEDVLSRVQQDGDVLEQATVITISAGANNLLPLVRHNPSAGIISYSQVAANFSLNRARQDMELLLTEVKSRAPQAEIYVMGYYFPYTSVHETQKRGVEEQLTILNQILENAAKDAGVYFVPVHFEDGTQYLPNVTDVHPNQLGYMQMANAFLMEYGLPNLTVADLPQPNPMTFQEILEMQQPTQQQTVAMKPIEEYFVYYGYVRFERFFL